MPKKPIKIKLPQLYTAGGDITKQWRVYYSYRNPETGKMERFNVTEGINKIHDYEQRLKSAKKLAAKYKRKLEGGFNPFEDERYIYEDVTEYAPPGKEHQIEEQDFSHTLIQCLSNVLAQHKARLRPASFKAYQGHLRVFKRTLEEQSKEDITIANFNRKDALAFLMGLDVHNTTRRAYTATFRALYNLLIDQELTTINPFADLKLPKAQTTNAKRAFTGREQKRIKNYCLTHGHEEIWMVVQFVYYCYIRPGELRNVRVSDIDLDKEKVLVRAEVAKNKKRQYVTIPSAFLPHVAAWIKDREPSHYLFGRNGKPRGREYFRKMHKQILKELRMKDDVGLYSWKHTGVVEFYQAAQDIESLRQQLRHSSLDQVLAYLHSLGLVENTQAKHNFPAL